MMLRALDWLVSFAGKAVATFNFVEALFWLAMSAGFLRRAVLRKGDGGGTFCVAAVLFFFFGLSDFVEVGTGAWWRPWWLFAWKAACLVGLVSIYVRYRLVSRTGRLECPIFWTG